MVSPERDISPFPILPVTDTFLIPVISLLVSNTTAFPPNAEPLVIPLVLSKSVSVTEVAPIVNPFAAVDIELADTLVADNAAISDMFLSLLTINTLPLAAVPGVIPDNLSSSGPVTLSPFNLLISAGDDDMSTPPT